jgi:hypothetical protein
MAGAASMLEVFQWLMVQLAAFQAVLLLASALHKMAWPDRARTVVHEFVGVPSRLALAAIALIAAAEALAGYLLWTQAYRAAGGALAALIWSAYLALILRSIAQGRRDVDCGCSFGAAQRPLGTYQVVRNVLLAGVASLVAAVSAASAGGPVLGSQILAAIALLVLYGALDQAMALTPPRTGEVL